MKDQAGVVRDRRVAAGIEQALQDLRYGLRVLRRNPGFAAVSVLTLALGIGVNATLFALFDAVALRPVRLSNGESLVSVYQTLHGAVDRNVHGGMSLFSYPEYLAYASRNESFAGLTAYMPEFSAMVAQDPRPIQGQLTACNYFDVMGGRPAAGRGFLAADCAFEGSGSVVVISDDLWRARFGGDRGVVGTVVKFNRVPLTIVGIAPPGFHGTEIIASSFWIPISMERRLTGHTALLYMTAQNLSWLAMAGRLKPGVTSAQARANLGTVAAGFDRQYPGRVTTLAVAEASYFGAPEKHAAALAAGSAAQLAVGLVLLIACANIANLAFARATARKAEIAVRLAIGASRGRIVRQLLTESLLIAGFGGAAGTIVAIGCARVIAAAIMRAAGGVPVRIAVVPDARILLYGLAMSAVTGVAVGLAPALRATRRDLRGGARVALVPQGRLRRALVGVQAAVCMVLLVAAGLLTRGMYHVQAAEPGFSTSDVLTATFDLQLEGYSAARASAFLRAVDERLRALPGVVAVSMGASSPLQGNHQFAPFRRADARDRVIVEFQQVLPGYLSSFGVPLVRGRDFTEAEYRAGVPVAIVNEAAARKLWPNQDPVGARLHGHPDRDYDVVGVARDADIATLGDTHEPYIFLAAHPADALALKAILLRTSAGNAALATAARAAILSLDPELHVSVAPLRDNLAPYVKGTEALAGGSATLAALALGLAAIGIYGTVSYSVSRRVREIGIRLALGASPGEVRALIARQALRPVVVGAGVGLLLCVATSRVLTGLLFGVSPLDPIAFITVAACLLAVAALASYVPTRAALAVDPMTALRSE